jgi:hypothetical protein
MISPYPRLKVNVAEQLAPFYCRRRAHTISETRRNQWNHGRRSAASVFFNSLLGLDNEASTVLETLDEMPKPRSTHGG